MLMAESNVGSTAGLCAGLALIFFIRQQPLPIIIKNKFKF